MDLLRVLYKRVLSDSSHYEKKKKKIHSPVWKTQECSTRKDDNGLFHLPSLHPNLHLGAGINSLCFYLWCCFSVLSADGLKVLLVMDILISSHQQALLWGSPQIAIGSKTNTTNCLFWFWWKPAAFDFSVVSSGNCICQDHWLFPPLSELLMGTSF